MQFCKPVSSQNWILISLTSLVLVSGICASSAIAQPLSARTELTSLLDADRLHLNAKGINYAESVLDKLLVDAVRNNEVEKAATYATDHGLLKLVQNDLPEAQRYCTIGLETRLKNCEPNDPNLADSYNALAMVTLGEQDHQLARQYAQNAIDIELKDPDRNAMRLSDSYDTMARIELDEGNFVQAESPAVQAWKIRTRVLGAANPVVAQSLYTLSLYYAQKGDLGNAQSLLQDSILYGDALQRAHSLLAQSSMYAAQGNIELARKTFDEGADLKASVLGKTSPGNASFKALFIKHLWNHQHWLDAVQMSNSLAQNSQISSTQKLDLDGRLIERSFLQKQLPQHLNLKNMIIVGAITVAAMVVIALFLCTPQLLYLPNGNGLAEFLRSTRREDLRGEHSQGDTLKRASNFPNRKLGFHAERTTSASPAAVAVKEDSNRD
jgi:tetratricopeptide (TPR) repeat protein